MAAGASGDPRAVVASRWAPWLVARLPTCQVPQTEEFAEADPEAKQQSVFLLQPSGGQRLVGLVLLEAPPGR